jgi:hypothetical protein
MNAVDERRIYWLLELTGNGRAVWGPYTWTDALGERGSRYQIVGGHGLRDGQSMTAGEIQAAFQSGRIYPVTSAEALKV